MLHDQDLLSIQEARSKVEKAYEAFQKYRNFTQQQVDSIVAHVAAVARSQARRLAEMAVEETGYGNVPDKTAKNLLCSELLLKSIAPMKTVGVLREDPQNRVIEIGTGVGVVAAVVPTTNPTSTVIYKALVSLKAGNSVVISPHPRAKNCTCYTADLLYRAAVEAGAPENIIQCVLNSTMEGTSALMKHPRTGVILATGGQAMVRAAYSSGKPAFGVGPGNVCVLIDKSADLASAVASVVTGKTFDYGTVCSSEQSVVATVDLREKILAELKKNKAVICDAAQTEALSRLLVTPKWTINPDCVGQPAPKIARMAGFEVPADTAVLVTEIGGVGKQHPLSMEKLSPVLSLLFVRDWEESIRTCQAILKFGGLGHTCVIHSRDEDRIREFGIRMPAFRVLVNTPAPQGSVGVTTALLPSMTLGCGAMGGNVTSDNVGPLHLINIKRVAYKIREAEEALSVPDYLPAPPPPPQILSTSAITAAVERYLAQRGLLAAPKTAEVAPPRAAAPAPAPAVKSGVLGNVAQEVVDRFLGARLSAAPIPGPAAAPAPACGCSVPSAPAPAAAPPAVAAPAPAPPPAPAAPPAPPAPEIKVVDFVCEADVRAAMAKKQKIYIGPKTIVTPSAREFGEANDVLVMARRS